MDRLKLNKIITLFLCVAFLINASAVNAGANAHNEQVRSDADYINSHEKAGLIAVYAAEAVAGWVIKTLFFGMVSFEYTEDPLIKSIKPVGVPELLSLDNEAGIISLKIKDALPECLPDEIGIVLEIDGEKYDYNEELIASYTYTYYPHERVGVAEWNFEPVVSFGADIILSAEIEYNGHVMGAEATVIGYGPRFFQEKGYLSLMTPSAVSFPMTLGTEEYMAIDISMVELISGASLISASALCRPEQYDNDSDSLTFNGEYLSELFADAIDGQSYEFAIGFDDAALTKRMISITAVGDDIRSFSIGFDSMGGSPIPDWLVCEGDLINQPADPIKGGYMFVGWFKERSLINLWNFAEDRVKNDTILYAGWGYKPIATPIPSSASVSGSSASVPIPTDIMLDINHLIESELKNTTGNIAINLMRDTSAVSINAVNLLKLIEEHRNLDINGKNVSLILDMAFLESLELAEEDEITIRFQPVRPNIKKDVSSIDKANDRLVANSFDISLLINGERYDNFNSPVKIRLSLTRLALDSDQRDRLTGVRYVNNGGFCRLGGKPVRLESEDWFEFATSSLSRYGLLITDDVSFISAAIGRSAFTVNGELKTSDTAPFIKDGTTMVPLRFVAEALGAKVDWNADSKNVSISLDGEKISFRIGVLYDGMGSPAVIVDERTYVPLRYVSEKLGCNVIWYGNKYAIDITR